MSSRVCKWRPTSENATRTDSPALSRTNGTSRPAARSVAFAQASPRPRTARTHGAGPSLAHRARVDASGGGPSPRVGDPASNSRGAATPPTVRVAYASIAPPGVAG